MKEAIRGLRVFYQSKGARLVPVNEMVDAVTVNAAAKAQIGARACRACAMCACADAVHACV